MEAIIYYSLWISITTIMELTWFKKHQNKVATIFTYLFTFIISSIGYYFQLMSKL